MNKFKIQSVLAKTVPHSVSTISLGTPINIPVSSQNANVPVGSWLERDAVGQESEGLSALCLARPCLESPN